MARVFRLAIRRIIAPAAEDQRFVTRRHAHLMGIDAEIGFGVLCHLVADAAVGT